ncbi:hypothetical protein JTE90_013954 [Oedothorax gibbosus]|uniref:Ionotropic glutamate receptor L-glutamate and glycine-binding domain-containing protein n=1 Tax=Oedothorax gibbosus TaxID=931172 RepID=A0AAV6UE60_9ARAC|nr:hypothetical protein JTE90_013954 [Oedothorax gibbosus]
MQKLRISVIPWNPWVMFPQGNISNARGVIIDIYQALKNSEVFNYELQHAESYGSLGKDNKWTGMIRQMIDNETDLSGPFFLDEAKAKVVDYNAPLFFTQLVIVTNLVPSNKDPFLVFGIFSVHVWLMLLFSAIVASGVALLIYSYLPYRNKRNKIDVFLQYMWIFNTSLIGNGFGSNGRWYLRPVWSSTSFRTVETVWFITCLVFVYTFQGSIISTYTSGKMKPRHESLEDMLQDTRTEIGSFGNSHPAICLSKLVQTRFEPIWTRAQKNLLGVKDLVGRPVWLESIESGKKVFVAESIYTRYLIGEMFKDTGRCGIRVIPLDICSTYLALVSRKNISRRMKSQIDQGVLRFNEAGLSKRHTSQSLLFYDICTAASTSPIKSLDLTDLLGAFIVLCAGLLLSVMYFFLELVLKRSCD